MMWTVLDKEKRGIRRKEGRGGRRDEEERGTRRKAGRGWRNEESEKNEKVVKKMEIEKVVKGRITGLAGPCSFNSMYWQFSQ